MYLLLNYMPALFLGRACYFKVGVYSVLWLLAQAAIIFISFISHREQRLVCQPTNEAAGKVDGYTQVSGWQTRQSPSWEITKYLSKVQYLTMWLMHHTL